MDDEAEEPTTAHDVALTAERITTLLTNGTVELEGLMHDSSNYTFLVRVQDEDLAGLAIYKPRRGERPLWDFPRGTLCQREAAAYVVSEALGWRLVPPTVLREVEPHGFGSVQLFIDADPNMHYFSLRGNFDDEFRCIAAFDLIINNADRKGGHVLLGGEGRLWAIDHGITFHVEPKLRTVIWEYAGQPIPRTLVDDVSTFFTNFESSGDPTRELLKELLDRQEIDALRRRVERLVRRPVFPQPGSGRSMPWPPV